MITHKRGDTLDLLAAIPDMFPDGHFVGWTVTAQLRTAKYSYLIDDLTCEWIDAALTRILHVEAFNTTNWQIGPAKMDIQFVRDTDSYTVSSVTLDVLIVQDITYPDGVHNND